MPTPFIPVRWLIDTPNNGDPEVFPLLQGQMFLSLKTPRWSTKIQTSKSGGRIAAANWSYPVWDFVVAYEFLRDRPPTQDELWQIYAFFNKRQGQAGSFYYWDPTEPDLVDQSIGVGDGLNTLFQLTRTRQGFTEPVAKTSGIVSVKVDGVANTDWTLSDKGVLTFGTAPAAGKVVAWSGRPMYVCAFSDDSLSAEQMTRDLWSMEGIKFSSLKLVT